MRRTAIGRVWQLVMACVASTPGWRESVGSPDRHFGRPAAAGWLDAQLQLRLETIAIRTSAAQTAITPGRPVKIAAQANSGTEIAIDPSTITF
jgi:hypothetical protein